MHDMAKSKLPTSLKEYDIFYKEEVKTWNIKLSTQLMWKKRNFVSSSHIKPWNWKRYILHFLTNENYLVSKHETRNDIFYAF